MITKTPVVLLCTIIAVLLLATVADAQPTSDPQNNAAVQLTREQKSFDYADILFKRKDYTSAIEEYRRFMKDFPKSASSELALRRIAVSYQEMGDSDKALEIFRQYVKTWPNGEKTVEAHIQIGIQLLELGQKAGAVQTLLKVAKRKNLTDTQKEMLYYYLGRAQHEREKHKEAIAQYRACVKGHPKGEYSPWARFYLAECLRKTGDNDAALKLYTELLTLTKGARAKQLSKLLRTAQYNRAETLFDMKQYTKAAKAYQEAANKYPGTSFADQAAYGVVYSAVAQKDRKKVVQLASNYLSRRPKSKLRNAVLLIKANAHFELKQYQDASTAYRAVIDSSKDTSQQARAASRILWCSYNLKQYKTVIKDAQVFLAKYPKDSEVGNIHFLMGRCLHALGEYDKALLEFLVVLSNYKDSSFVEDSAYLAGLCYYLQDRLPEATNVFESFHKSYAKSNLAPDALWLAGESHRRLGDLATAADRYTALLDRYPNFRDHDKVWYNLFYCRRTLKQWEEMRTTGDAFLAARPKDEQCNEILYSIAFSYWKESNHKSAIERCRQLLKMKKSKYHPDARYLLARGLCELKKYGEGIAEFKTLITSKPPYAVPIEWHLFAARFLYREDKWQDSLTLWTLASERPEIGDAANEALWRIGCCYLRLGDYAVARRHLLDFIERSPKAYEVPETFYYVAQTYSGQKKWEDAIEFYDKCRDAGEFSNENAQLVLAIKSMVESAECRMELKRYKEAGRELDRLIAQHEFDWSDYKPRAHFRLAECMEKQNKKKEAQAHYKVVVDKFAKSDWASKASDRIAKDATGSKTDK
jgi:TolA-binding protein